jgi:hypothetical protein
MFAQSGARPAQRVGPIGIVPAQPVGAPAPLLQPSEPRYPAYRPEVKEPEPHLVSVPLTAGQFIAVSNLGFAFNVEPQVTVRIAGREVPAAAQDRVAAVYACAGCEPGTSVTAELTIVSGDFADVDIVVF